MVPPARAEVLHVLGATTAEPVIGMAQVRVARFVLFGVQLLPAHFLQLTQVIYDEPLY